MIQYVFEDSGCDLGSTFCVLFIFIRISLVRHSMNITIHLFHILFISCVSSVSSVSCFSFHLSHPFHPFHLFHIIRFIAIISSVSALSSVSPLSSPVFHLFSPALSLHHFMYVTSVSTSPSFIHSVLYRIPLR